MIQVKPGSHITIMVPGVPVIVSKAEYDYTVPASCSRYRRQSSILSAVPPVPYSQGKAISRVFAEVKFFVVRFQNGCKKTRNKQFLPIFFSSWLSKTQPKKKSSRT